MTTMSFPDAIQKVIDGFRVARLSWNDTTTYVLLHEGFLKIRKKDGTYPSLLVSEADMLAVDWVTVSD